MKKKKKLSERFTQPSTVTLLTMEEALRDMERKEKERKELHKSLINNDK